MLLHGGRSAVLFQLTYFPGLSLFIPCGSVAGECWNFSSHERGGKKSTLISRSWGKIFDFVSKTSLDHFLSRFVRPAGALNVMQDLGTCMGTCGGCVCGRGCVALVAVSDQYALGFL